MKVHFTGLQRQHEGLKKEIMKEVERVLTHARFVSGQEVEQFEEKFAEYCRVPHAAAVGSGTDALLLSLKTLGIGPGCEVITVPNSFIATTGSIVAVGAVPVYVDVDKDMNMDPRKIEDAISPRTGGIVPVHLNGRGARMDKILNIAGRHGIPVIEDSCQAIGARLHGNRLGTLGDLGCFSLHPLKVLGVCGDGGAVISRNADWIQKIKKWRNHGLMNRNEAEIFGINSRLDSIQAAVGSLKIGLVDGWVGERRRLAQIISGGWGIY